MSIKKEKSKPLNKSCNVSFDQIPHIVMNHPDTTPYHWAIMIALFKVLKDIPKCVYTNETLSKNCKIPLRTVERRISELNKMGLIICTGKGYNRRISLGLIFNNPATMAVDNEQKVNNSAKFANTTAKNDVHNRHGGGDSNTYTNTPTKEEYLSLSRSEQQDIDWYRKNKQSLPEELAYLQPFLDEALKDDDYQ